jgi:ArsR family transcriptional regulator, virulence genes transcriptional regulator
MVNMEISLLEPKAEEAVRLLTAMANTKRLLILCNLLDRELTVGELTDKVDLAQSALSQHLSKLRAWNLVKARREGQMVYYSLASVEVRRILTTLYAIYCEPGSPLPARRSRANPDRGS